MYFKKKNNAFSLKTKGLTKTEVVTVGGGKNKQNITR